MYALEILVESFSLVLPAFLARFFAKTEALVFFLGFIVAVEILLNMNPIVFTISLVLYEVLLTVLYALKIISFRIDFDSDLLTNLLFLDGIVI